MKLSEEIITTLSLVRFRTMGREQLVRVVEFHDHKLEDIERALVGLLADGSIELNNGFYFLPMSEEEKEPIPQRSLDAADAYKKRNQQSAIGKAAFKLGPHIAFIIAIATTLLICLASVGKAEEVPSWVLPGMLHVESSSYYSGDKIIYVNQKRGKAGEIGCFQSLPATLRQFNFSPSLYEQDTKYAEDATTKILTHYRRITGSWDEAVGAWNCGLGKRKTKTAIKYINRVKSAGENK